MLKRLTKPVSISVLAIIGLALTVWAFTDKTSDIVVSTSLGEIVGVSNTKTGVTTFKGIRYAAAPIGERRWAPPQAAPAWQGRYDARDFGDICVQEQGELTAFLDLMGRMMGHSYLRRSFIGLAVGFSEPPSQSEDCLFLNIRTPHLNGDKLSPVMVWLHGGGHQTGAGSDPYFQSDRLSQDGVVLVTINYRLGAFGYMAHPALSAESPSGVSGNYGLQDQISALQWVRAHIQDYGGDPDNVTLFGQSAGGQSISALMAAPTSHGLYSKAILQSGVLVNETRHLSRGNDTVPSAESVGAEFINPLLPSNSEVTANALRAISTEAILTRAAEEPDFLLAFVPVHDEQLIPNRFAEAFANGSIPDIPIMAGYNADEGSILYPFINSPTLWNMSFPNGLSTRKTALSEVFGAEAAERLTTLYGLDDEETWQSAEADMLGDDFFGVTTRFALKSASENGQPTYGYFFTRVPPSKTQTAGAFHAGELPFIFDTHDPFFVARGRDHELPPTLFLLWTNFAKTGDPNGDGLVPWPRFEPSTQTWLELNHDIAPVSKIRADKLDLLEVELVSRTLAPSALSPE